MSNNQSQHKKRWALKEAKLSAERLRELFDYDHETGLLIRKVTTAGNAKAGTIAGCLANTGYLLIRVDGQLFLAHRLAWLHFYGRWPQGMLDHANTVKIDNWIENLREASSSQNHANRGLDANNTSGIKGVAWDARAKRWRAQIKKEKKNKFLGYYDSAHDAAMAYEIAARALFGEFARSK